MRELIIQAFKDQVLGQSLVAIKYCGKLDGIKYSYAEMVDKLDVLSDEVLLEYYTDFLQDTWNFWRD